MAGFWQQRTASERRLLVLCLIVVVVGGWMLMTPTQGSTRKLLSAAEASQKYEKAVQEKTRKEADIARLDPEIKRLTYKETPEQVFPQIIRSLQDTARSAGIHIREIKPLRIRRVAGLTKVPMSVRFSCDFSKTVPFLYNTEDPSGKLVIDRLTVTAPDAQSRVVDVEVHVAFFTSNAAAAEAGTAAGT